MTATPLLSSNGDNHEQQQSSPSPSSLGNIIDGNDDNTCTLDNFGVSFSHMWNILLSNARWPILLLTVALLWPLGFFSFSHLNDKIDSTFTPIGRSALAEAAFDQNYAPNTDNDPILLVLESRSNSSMTHDSPMYDIAKEFCEGLERTLHENCWKVTNDLECQSDNPKIAMTSFFSLEAQDLHLLAHETMATTDGNTMLVEIQYLFQPNATHVHERESQLQDVILNYITTASATTNHHNSTEPSAASQGMMKVSYTGIPFFSHDLKEATKADLRRMDMIALPIALILLGIVLPKTHFCFVMIIPLVTMLSTVSFWSILMNYLVAPYMQITSTTPSLMMSLTLGMGIDYTLFLLSRYTEDDWNIQQMIYSGGSVVLWSGTTLLCSFLGLVLLPLQMLRSIGVGAAVAIICSLIINLTLVPVLLHTPLGRWIIVQKDNTNQEEEDDNSSLDNMMFRDDDDDEQIIAEQIMAQSEGEMIVPNNKSVFWTRLTKHLLHPYKSVIIILVISNVLVPIAQNVTRLKTSISFDLALPASSPSVQTLERLGETFGTGRLAPYRILFDSHAANFTMTSAKGFEIMHKVLNQLIAIDDGDDDSDLLMDTAVIPEVDVWTNAWMETISSFSQSEKEIDRTNHTEQEQRHQELLLTRNSSKKNKFNLKQKPHSSTTQYNGIAMVKNVQIPHEVYAAAKLCALVEKPYCAIETLHTLQYVDQAATSHDHYATYVVASFVEKNAFSEEGLAWLKAARATIDSSSLAGVQVHIAGSAAIASDAVNAVMDAFPFVIGLTLSIVFLLLSICFQSIVAPLRSILSITMTLGFSFGITSWFFHGVLSWLVPVMSFSIIVGLALDYDLFLTSRIWECRFIAGQSHVASIGSGLQTTGNIIVAAGCIMAVAFGGFLRSSCPVLYQWAFLMSCAVLFDTLVVRTMVVPIFLYWTGSKWSWWPRTIIPSDGTNTSSSRSSISKGWCCWRRENQIVEETSNNNELIEPLLLINN